MLADLSTEELQHLNCCCEQLLLQVSRKRGARLRPLAGATRRLERALEKSYKQLFRDVVASLRGASDDIVKGRLSQQELTVEEREALRTFRIPVDEAEEEVDKSRLAAVLLLILLWRSRHVGIADTFVGELFDLGRERVLKRLKVTDAPRLQETAALRDETLNLYRQDIDRLQAALTDGSPRSGGIRQAVEDSDTLAEAAVALRKLYEADGYRLNLFAESLIWTAYLQGQRAGAVDGTRTLLERGALENELPRFRFEGPLDDRMCGNCRAYWGTEVVATSIDDIPLTQNICQFGRSCRHIFRLVR